MARVKIDFVGDKSHFDGVVKGVKNEVGSLKGMVAGALTVGAAMELVNKTAEYADSMDKASLRMKLTVEETQALSIIAKDAGSNLETVEAAFQKIAIAREKALKGDKDAIANFAKLGVTQEQLKTASKTDLAAKVAAGAGNGGEAQTTALAGLGLKGAAGDLTAIGSALQNLNEKTEELKAKGAIMDDETIANIAEAKDQLELLGTTVMATIAPYISDAIDGFKIMWNTISIFIKNFFAAIILGFQNGIETITNLIKHPFSAKETITKGIKNSMEIGKSVFTDTAKETGEYIDSLEKEKAERKKTREANRKDNLNGVGADSSNTKENKSKSNKLFTDSLTSSGNMLGNSFGNVSAVTTIDLQKQTIRATEKVALAVDKQTKVIENVEKNTKPTMDKTFAGV